jgi:hypothetical protein
MNAPYPDGAEPMGDVRLSDLFADPFLRRAFRRAERDGGQACAIPAPRPKPKLAGGAVALPEPAGELCR